MQNIQALETQIEKLQQRRDVLKQKEDHQFLKKLQAFCGEEFSHQMVLGIVSTAWEKATPEQKEAWRSAGGTFWQKPGKTNPSP
jgi:hypothetical protein